VRRILFTLATGGLLLSGCNRQPDLNEMAEPPDPSLHQGARTGPSVEVVPIARDTPTAQVDTTLLPDSLPGQQL
jgi:uncharacterized lipoprotein YajG